LSNACCCWLEKRLLEEDLLLFCAPSLGEGWGWEENGSSNPLAGCTGADSN
jgi:hypothetical protein